MACPGLILNERYELLTEIGKGGMSSVYLAQDRNLGSYWAVKCMRNDASAETVNFKREVEMLAGLNHWAIPRVVDRIEAAEEYFVVMDFVDGVSLGKKLLSEGPQAEKNIVEWAEECCDVLSYLHTEAGPYPLVYCDIKPDNLMLNQGGQLRLIDFGTVHEIRPGDGCQKANWGTKGFAAPEQYKSSNLPIGPRSDIYALGVTLFNLATAEVPGLPPEAVPLLRKVNPAYSEGLEYIIAKATRDDPEKRYKSAKEMAYDLKHINELNSGYRHKMKKRLIIFSSVFAASLIGFGTMIFGYSGMQNDSEKRFQTAFKNGTQLEQAGKNNEAADAYLIALNNKNSDFDACMRYFQMILPGKDSPDPEGETKNAIDMMRKRFLENSASPLSRNAVLKMAVVRQAMNLNDPVYAGYALKYLEEIKEGRDEGADDVNRTELEAYSLLARQMSETGTEKDFEALGRALTELRELSESEKTTAARRLNHYYIIMQFYSTYPANLPDSYELLYKLGSESKKILDSDAFLKDEIQNAAGEQDVTFKQIIPLYRMVASGLYNQGVLADDPQKATEAMLRSLEWYGYLDSLSLDIKADEHMRIGNAYRALAQNMDSADKEIIRPKKASVLKGMDRGGLMKAAVKEYKAAIEKDSAEILAHINLTQSLLDIESEKDIKNRSYGEVLTAYKELQKAEEAKGELSSLELSRMGVLREQLKGLGVIS